MANHWARPGGGPANRSFYWYLTFPRGRQLRELARRCQKEISFSYYDLTPLDDLHLTVNRVAYQNTVGASDLDAVIAKAREVCQSVTAFTVSVGRLSGTPGALGFNVSPYEPLRNLHDRLTAATLQVLPDAPVKHREFHAHVAVAYGNADVPSAEAVAVVEQLHRLPEADVLVDGVSLVLLERDHRSYRWQTVETVAFAKAHDADSATSC
ncbi:2'-5' RNA ligase family protein [Actinoplanes nipponensis]|uniref:2'-5' RNA ligase family protein n=1 Tax=Actinoplanes nipponensis TaxID=135950 RepID=UPI001942D3DA|nr:2'-5' RNA ligase family protein [Actinoplanes nipponensis]